MNIIGRVQVSGNMLIYCNGDSFVAGVELGDNILSDYPGLSDFGADKTLPTKWIASTYDPNHIYGKERQEKTKEILELEYQRSFPNKLKERLNIPVINHALGGSSMDRIVRTTITDLISLKKEHDEIIAIIGDTHWSRSEMPNFEFIDSPDAVGFNRHWVCITSTYHMSGREPLNPVRDYKIRYEKNYHMLVKYYSNVIRLQDFCKANDIKLYWVSTTADVESTSVEKQYADDLCYTNFISYANLKFTIKMRDIAKQIYNKVLCPSNHYGENVHEEVANRLVTIIKENHNV